MSNFTDLVEGIPVLYAKQRKQATLLVVSSPKSPSTILSTACKPRVGDVHHQDHRRQLDIAACTGTTQCQEHMCSNTQVKTLGDLLCTLLQNLCSTSNRFFLVHDNRHSVSQCPLSGSCHRYTWKKQQKNNYLAAAVYGMLAAGADVTGTNTTRTIILYCL